MENINIDDMFNTIKGSLSAVSEGNGAFKEKIKFEIGKDYLVRLIPYKADLSKSIVHHINFSYKKHDGNWANVLSARTFGERCALADYFDKIHYKGSAEEKASLRESMWKKEGWYVNALIVRNTANPEWNGKVKILDLGFALYKLLERAMNGEFDKAWSAQANAYRTPGSEPISINVGKKIFDLTNTGANLLIRVRKNDGGMHDYKSSEFTLEDAVLNLTSEQIDEIDKSAFDLTKLDRVVDADTALKDFRDNYCGFDGPAEMSPVASKPASPMSAFMSSTRPASEPVVESKSLPMTSTNPFLSSTTSTETTTPNEDNTSSFDTESQMDSFLDRYK